MPLIDQSWSICSIDSPCLTEIGACVVCEVIPGPTNSNTQTVSQVRADVCLNEKSWPGLPVTHQMMMKKGTAKSSDVSPWIRVCSELGKELTVCGMTSQVVLKLVNGPQAFEEGMLPGQREEAQPRPGGLPPHGQHVYLQ